MYAELCQRVSEMLKCECQDVFFDLLAPELNIEGVVFFFTRVFLEVEKAIQRYFAPLE